MPSPGELDEDLDVAHLREVVVPLELRVPRALLGHPQRRLELPVLRRHGLQVRRDLAALGHPVVLVVVLLVMGGVEGPLLFENV